VKFTQTVSRDGYETIELAEGLKVNLGEKGKRSRRGDSRQEFSIFVHGEPEGEAV